LKKRVAIQATYLIVSVGEGEGRHFFAKELSDTLEVHLGKLNAKS